RYSSSSAINARTASGIGLSIALSCEGGGQHLVNVLPSQWVIPAECESPLDHRLIHHAPRLGLLRQGGCDGADADFVVAVLDPFAVSRGGRRSEHTDPLVLSRQQLPRPLL